MLGRGKEGLLYFHISLESDKFYKLQRTSRMVRRYFVEPARRVRDDTKKRRIAASKQIHFVNTSLRCEVNRNFDQSQYM